MTESKDRDERPDARIYIIGAGFAGRSIAREIRSKGIFGRVVAFLDDDPAKIGLAWAQQHLASYKAPRVVYLVDELPRTRNGKVQRRALTASLARARAESRGAA